jgi:HK97 family phage prohead protease
MIRKADLYNSQDPPLERRDIAGELEVRSTGDNTVKLTGYASVFNKGYEVNGGPSNPKGWTERVVPEAFKRTLSDKPFVHLLINHEGTPLASTKSGTLRLSTDSQGLLAEAELDRRSTLHNDLIISMERGDIDEMSFAFRVTKQSWSDDETVRSLDEVSLHKGDVSVVNFGANPNTSVSLMRSAVGMLARGSISNEQLMELRAMGDQVDRAMTVLNDARNAPLTPGAHHADPGFLDKDGNPSKDGNGVPRYQIDDKAHAVNAASRFAQNKDKYTPAQQKQILDAIHAAEKKFGVEVEENSIHLTVEERATAGASFAQAVHDMASDSGADCSPGFEDGNDESDPEGSLAQAVHDLVADAAGCTNGDDVVDDSPYSEANNLTVADAQEATLGKGNLTLVEAARMCRPDDSPEPLTLAQALAQAS